MPMLTLWQSIFKGARVNAVKHPEVEAEMWNNVRELADAMDQLLDDMGRNGTSVCLAAKAKARVAFEPFMEPDAAELYMPLDEAKRIVAESDQ